MKIKQKITVGLLLLCTTVGTGLFVAQPALADCGGAKTSIISCNASDKSSSARDSAIWQVLLLVLNILTAGVGILAVGGIAYGSILYASAGDKPDNAKKGIEIIRNVVIGIVAYGVMYMVLNYLVPGGIFT